MKLTRTTPFRRNRPGRRIASVGLALTLGLAGCAVRAPRDRGAPVAPSGPAAGDPAPATFGPAYEALRTAARTSGTPDRDAPVPEGLDPAAVALIPPGTPEHARAVEPIRSVAARLAADAAPAPALHPASQPDDRIAALRRYAAGREKLIRGDARGAVDDLTAATRLDPGAPEPWRELGDAQSLVGSLLEAESSFQAALDRGLRDARVLEFLARAAWNAREPVRAAGLYALAIGTEARSADPALPLIIASGLGHALLAAGYLDAGCAALGRSLHLPERPPTPTRYVNELGAIYRRQGDAWRSMGDAHARLGRFDEALEAYARAATLPTMEGGDIPARVLFAAVRAGRPAAAALFVLDRIQSAGGRASREDAIMLRGLAGDRTVGRLTARALDELAASLGSTAAPSVLAGIARARAAVLPPAEAAGVLREHVRRHPSDASSVAELLELSRDAATEASGLVAAAPNYADRYADALCSVSADLPALLAALDARREDAARLLAVYVAARAQRTADAWARLEGFAPRGATGMETDTARTRLAAALGRWTDTERSLARLAALPVTPASARARARALWAARRAAEALDTLRPALGDPAASPAERLDDRLLAAELAMRLARADEAESWLHEASAIDPGDDRPCAMMLALHGPSGPKPDDERLAAVLRDLRAASPDSRLLGFIRAQEFLRRGFFAQAEQELRRLAEVDPTDPAVVELLCAVWTRPAQPPGSPELAAAMRYLDDQMRARPWSDVLLSARVRVLAAAGRTDEAEEALRARLGTGGGPELSRLLEGLLRRRGERDEADRLATARLSAPYRSIDESLEWIELLAAQERDAEAADALRDGLPAWAVLDAGQSDRLQASIGAIAARAAQDPKSPRGPALALLEEAVRRRLRLSPDLHDQRLALLAAEPDADADRLIAAADDAARDYPALGAAAYLRLAQALVAADRGDAAVALMERAGARDDASLDVIEAWLHVVRLSGSADQIRRVLDRAAVLGRIRPLVDRLMPNRVADEGASWDPRSVLAYELALIRAASDREDDAIALYELALEYDPKHGWANNNLGYHLVERGEQLDRAERLLEAAIESLPDDGSVLDSLGWLRYRLGVLQDVTDEAGNVVRPGALTLLRRAVRTDKGTGNQTILDHYADALWAAGQRADARRTWERADRAAGQRVRELRALDDGAPGRDRLVREANDVRASAQRKIQAVIRGEEPPIAPRAPSAPPPPAPPPLPAVQAGTPGG